MLISINSPDPLRLNALDAIRQIDLGTPPRVLSDLLGHRDPESIFAHVRIATDIGGPIATHTRAPEGIIAAPSGLLPPVTAVPAAKMLTRLPRASSTIFAAV